MAKTCVNSTSTTRTRITLTTNENTMANSLIRLQKPLARSTVASFGGFYSAVAILAPSIQRRKLNCSDIPVVSRSSKSAQPLIDHETRQLLVPRLFDLPA